MTTTTPTGSTFLRAAEALITHLAAHHLPEPTLLGVMTMGGWSQVRAQLRSRTVAEIAAELLIWAQTLNTLTIELRREPEGKRVQLSITSTLTGPTSGVELDVYGGAVHDPILIADLAPGEKRAGSMEELRLWSAGGGTA